MEYGHLGELRALIPDSVHVMALTATATRSSHAKERSIVVSLSLHKKNFLHYVHPKPQLEDFIAQMTACVKELKTCTPRTIIFCR